MSTPVLITKLHVPPPRLNIVLRPSLIERLNAGLSANRKLTVFSAPAGFGKTTLVCEWSAVCGRPVAWLSLDEGDNDLIRFLTYLVAALQTMMSKIGAGVLGMLQSPQPPSVESILTALLNEITTIPDPFILFLDDYHLIDAKPVDEALTFLLEHLPSQMHLVIAAREDPHLPLARLRARSQLTELRAADLRFTTAEAAEFLNRVVGLSISTEDIAALEARTEGWIAGLQLAAISMQGHHDTAGFIKSFTGSHHFVLDYLLEEVLHQQPKSIQAFMLRTSILDRLCGPLCDAVMGSPSASGQEILEYLERSNLFIVPLDTERRWYRYHHLFAELLRHRLNLSASSKEVEDGVAAYHIRASRWYEGNGLHIEAFQHAAAANNFESAERLITGKKMLLHFGGVMTTILRWLASLPATVLDERPQLRVQSALLSLAAGQATGIEEKLQAAEAVLANELQGGENDDKTRDLIGQIATARTTLALTRYQSDAMIAQARRALEYLHPDNLLPRFSATWSMGMAYHFRGERATAGLIYTEALSIAQASGNIFNASLATLCLGQMHELENRLFPAVETYRRSLQLIGDHDSHPSTSEAYLGLGRICYEWNDLDSAGSYGQQALQLAKQYDRLIDRFIFSEVFLARLKLARGEVASAAAMLANTMQTVHQHHFVHRIAEVAAAQVLVFIRQDDLVAAGHLAQTHDLPISQARVHLARGDAAAALAVLEAHRRHVEAMNWQDERLRVMVLQAIALHAQGEKAKALKLLDEVLALAEPGGFIRLFADEGIPMVRLLSEAAEHSIQPDYIARLLVVLNAEFQTSADMPGIPNSSPVQLAIESLSQRELEILRLVAHGLSNHEICNQLFLALDTVKGHNRRIFEKLHVNRRTEAVACARKLGLI